MRCYIGAVGGLLGVSGGAGGSGFSGPQQANISNPVTGQQITNAYSGVQSGLGQQQNLLSALQAQNGLQNQSQVYGQLQGVVNGTGPNPAQAQLAQATGANTANQAALMAGQRGASQNVGLIARQAAQQGAANQQNSAGQAATLQANQSLNALTAAGNMANTQAGNQIGQVNANTQAQQAEQQSLLGAQAAYNSAAVGSQQSVNTANAGLAGTTMQGQQAGIGGLFNGLGGVGGIASGIGSMFGAEGGRVSRKGFDNGGQVGSEFGNFQNNTPQAPPIPSAPPATAAPAKSSGGGGGGMASLAMLALMANGGPADPNQVMSQGPATPPTDNSAYKGKSKFGAFLTNQAKQVPGATAKAPDQSFGGNSGAQALYAGLSAKPTPKQPETPYPEDWRGSKDMEAQYVGANTALGAGGDKVVNGISPVSDQTGKLQEDEMAGNTDQITPNQDGTITSARGGQVPALVSPGEKRIKKEDLPKVAKGKNPMEVGKTIPGKPRVGGAKNSYANDTVPMTLNEGDIILPRSVTQAKHPHWEAHKFVSQLMAKKKRMPK